MYAPPACEVMARMAMPLPNNTTTRPRPRAPHRLASVLGIVLLWHGHLARVRSWPGWPMPLPNDTTTSPRPRVPHRLASVLGIVLLWHGHLARVRSWPGWPCHFQTTAHRNREKATWSWDFVVARACCPCEVMARMAMPLPNDSTTKSRPRVPQRRGLGFCCGTGILPVGGHGQDGHATSK